MKRKWTAWLLAGMITFSIAACGTDNSSQADAGSGEAGSTQTAEDTQSAENVDEQNEAETGNTETAGAEPASSSGSNILIAYFSVPEDIDTSGIDADAGASVVVKDGEKLGNVQFMAQTIQNTVGGDLFRIETTEQYPLAHEPLVDLASEEQAGNARPELSTHIESPEQYDVILLGYPNWWGDMPQALYTFLEEYDFSGKTIIPFCPHGGSGFSNTERTIAELQPGASVSSDGLSISRNDVADSADEVEAWAAGLGISQ